MYQRTRVNGRSNCRPSIFTICSLSVPFGRVTARPKEILLSVNGIRPPPQKICLRSSSLHNRAESQPNSRPNSFASNRTIRRVCVCNVIPNMKSKQNGKNNTDTDNSSFTMLTTLTMLQMCLARAEILNYHKQLWFVKTDYTRRTVKLTTRRQTYLEVRFA